MTEVSLTKFLDFVCQSGTPRYTIVRDWKLKTDYDPRRDFYKSFRDAVAEGHRQGMPQSTLDDLLPTLTDKKKIDAYASLVAGYSKWLRKKSVEWFQPERTNWSFNDLTININPELGLLINGTPYQIKLYFKEPKLNKFRIDIITHLLSVSRPPSLAQECRVAVLDVRRAKLFEAGAGEPALIATLKSDAMAWMTIWQEIEDK